MPYTQEQLLKRYKKLPQDVKDAIFSVDTANAIYNIGMRHKLMIDKIGKLAEETGLVMLGLIHPADFIINLSNRLEVDKKTAKKIAEEINREIFAKIRESLKKMHGIIDEAVEEEQAPKEQSEAVPEILKGTTAPEPIGPDFETKIKQEVSRSPAVMSKRKELPQSQKKPTSGYPGGKDPYREPID